MALSTALFVLLAFGSYTIWLPERWPLHLVEAGLTVLAASWLFNRTLRGRRLCWGAGGYVLMAAVFWAALLTAMGVTVYGHASRRELVDLAALLAIYLLGSHQLADVRLRESFLYRLLVFGTLTVVLAVTQYFTSEGRFFWLFESGYPDLLGPFQNRNNFAAFVELLVPLAAWRSVQESGDRCLWLGMTAMLVSAVVASTSRAGTAMVIGELCVVAVLCWRRRLLSARWLAWYGSAAAAMVLAGSFVVGWNALIRRFWEANLLGFRAEILESTMSMVASRPWTGFGPGTFQTVYPAFAVFDIGLVVNHAHNDWMEWCAEGGLPLFLLMIGFVAWHVGPALESVWGLGILAVFVHALVDYPLQRIGVAGWVVVMMAAVAAESHRRRLPLDHSHRTKARHLQS